MTAGRWLTVLLLAVLIVHVPPFLCLPPDNDVVLWDVCVRETFAGRVFYRDVFENNLPGMLWVQAPVRAVLGWRSEAIRAADLAVVAVCIWLLLRWLPEEASTTARVALALVLTGFYLSTSEWCHAQRDTWMLLPILLAASLRVRQQQQDAPSFRRAVVEGLLWGAAVWIKPFAVVPALTCWLASLPALRRTGRRVGIDLAGLLLGGLAAGAAGLARLWFEGSWEAFWDVLLVWNREYATFDYTEGQLALVWAGLFLRLFPWLLVHLAAIPVAITWLIRPQQAGRLAILGGLYLGWLAQAVLLQHFWDYLHVPPLLLAITVLGVEAARTTGTRQAAVVGLLALCLLVRLGPLTAARLPLWTDCLREGSTPRLRNRLSLLRRVDWEALEQLRHFLREQEVADGELSVLNMSCLSLYLDPPVRPATRYLMLQNVLFVFTRQRPRILAEVAASRQRYLVVDTRWAEWPRDEVPPRDDRVVFTAGQYRVYALKGKELDAWVAEHLELPQRRR